MDVAIGVTCVGRKAVGYVVHICVSIKLDAKPTCIQVCRVLAQTRVSACLSV